MRMLPSACCIGFLCTLISCTHKNIGQNDVEHIEIIHDQFNPKVDDLYLPGYKRYSWTDYPSDSIREIRERAKRLKQGMDEQQVIALMRPLVVSSSFSFLLAKYRDPEIIKKEFHFNESSKDLVKINQSSYDPKRSDRFYIFMEIPFSEKTGKLRKDGRELELNVKRIRHGTDALEFEGYRLPVSEKRPMYRYR